MLSSFLSLSLFLWPADFCSFSICQSLNLELELKLEMTRSHVSSFLSGESQWKVCRLCRPIACVWKRFTVCGVCCLCGSMRRMNISLQHFRSKRVASSSLAHNYSPLSTFHCPPSTVHHPLSTVHCPLSTVHCPAFRAVRVCFLPELDLHLLGEQKLVWPHSCSRPTSCPPSQMSPVDERRLVPMERRKNWSPSGRTSSSLWPVAADARDAKPMSPPRCL